MNKEMAMTTDHPADGLRPPVTEPPLPWWRFKIVWLVLGLPASVVVASLFTAGIAWRNVDPVITDARPSHSLAADDAAEHGQRATTALEPAVTARNHAATPGK